MTTYTELLPATKSEKHGSIIWTTDRQTDFSRHAGVLTICGTRNFDVYDVEEFGCDHGRGFMLFKKTPGTDVTEDQYAVFAGSDNVGNCECKGFYRHGKCKHLQAIAALLENRWI